MTGKKKFAIPTVDKILTAHFGHCDQFAIIDTENDGIISVDFVSPPVHQPGVYPRFLAEQGVDVIISGGMGHKAQDLFAQNNIEVCMGVIDGSPRSLVEQYLKKQLQTGQNLCDH
jgi:predicted Fe-Mo cluster-binding NifX family protein